EGRVKKDRRDAGTREQVQQVIVERLELVDLLPKLRIDRVQLFVQALKLFPGRFQFLIRGPELFVRGTAVIVGLFARHRRVNIHRGQTAIIHEMPLDFKAGNAPGLGASDSVDIGKIGRAAGFPRTGKCPGYDTQSRSEAIPYAGEGPEHYSVRISVKIGRAT